jgi:hypothetical protein
MIAWVEAHGDITMPELAARLLAEHGVKAHPASLSRLLIHHGFTVKKTLLASETDRADIVRARQVWQNHRQPWMKKHPERLVLSMKAEQPPRWRDCGAGHAEGSG